MAKIIYLIQKDMIVIDNSKVLLTYKVEIESVVLVWKGFVKSEEYRTVMTEAYETAKLHKAKNWLSDMTNAKVVTQEDQKWVNEYLIPEGYKIGVKKVGMVLSENVFNEMFAKKLGANINDFDDNISVGYFYTMDQAEEWIK